MEEEGVVEVLWENLEEVLVGDLVVEDGDLFAFTFLNKCLVCSQGQPRNMAELPGTDTKDMRYHTATPCLADQEFLKFK